MCAIMGYTQRDIPLSRLEAAFAAAKSRGPDDSRTLEAGSGVLLFHRLAIMGVHPEGMQPFTAPDGSAVVCNGELYGFRKLKKEMEARGYVFASGSDCELLLPLWREHGAFVLWVQQVRAHPVCQRAQVPAGAGGQDHAFPAGALL